MMTRPSMSYGVLSCRDSSNPQQGSGLSYDSVSDPGSTSNSQDEPVPPPVTVKPPDKLNDTLYQLHKPVGKPSMEVLFFHGLQFGDYTDAYLSSWKSGDGLHPWPQTWLVEEFPGARIYSVSYDACLRKSFKDGKIDLNSIGENLTSDLIEMGNIGQETRCPVILVGHSFGGLVIKQLCLQVQETVSLRRASEKPKLKKFLESLQGMVYYGTPHNGCSPILDVASHFVSGLLLEYVISLGKEAARLNLNFDLLCRLHNNQWRISGVGEKLPTDWGLFHGMVVPEASARYGINFSVAEADHIQLCKPMAKTSNSFLCLTKVMRNIAKKEEARPENFQRVPKGAIGVVQQVEQVKEILQGAACLGLVGIGGIGKTTLAKAAFNTLGLHYEYSCFVQQVKKINGGVESVMKVVSEHMHYQGKKIAQTEGGLQFLRGNRLLLILDDVYSEDRVLQVLSFLKNNIDVHRDSRFIVTSRNSTFLKHLDAVYEVPLLKDGPATQLLLSHSFPLHRVAPSLFQGSIEEVVKKCAGLPLTLEVLGKYLYRCPLKIWEQTVVALDKAAEFSGKDDKICAKLKVSYDGLKEEEQKMFVEAATVFSSWPLCKAKAIWSVTMDGAEHIRWQNLVNLSLVWEVEALEDAFYNPWREDISAIFNPFFNPWREDGRVIEMHELLEAMGRNIALVSVGSGKYSRYQDSRGAWECLSRQGSNGIEEVVALHLDREELGEADKRSVIGDSNHLSSSPVEMIHITRDPLSKMGKLRYLILRGGVEICGVDGETFPVNLVFLQLREAQCTKLPFEPSFLKRLAVLELTDCEQLCTLPETFGQLSALRIIEIEHATSLVSLPKSFGQLLYLDRMSLIGCPMLRTLPEDFGRLPKLRHLGLVRCGLQSLPESFGTLPQLQYLGIIKCDELRTLPSSFGFLSQLEKLTINRCSTFQSLPETFGQLFSLRTLQLVWCEALQLLPDSLADLSGLENLRIHFCNLREVPKTSRALKNLEFSSCPKPFV